MRKPSGAQGSRCCASLVLFGLSCVLVPIDYGRAYGQEPPLTGQPYVAPKQGGSPNVFHTGNEDYRMGSGDLIQIQIEKAPELSGTYHIGNDGTIDIQYLGRLSARGKTLEELSRAISDGLKGRYLKNPHVVVDVLQYNSRTFFIQGAVRNPGVYQVDGKPTLLQLINIAGGLAENHSATAFVIRALKEQAAYQDGYQSSPGSLTNGDEASRAGSGPAAKYELHKANIAGLYKGNFDQDVVIEPGDIVNIPKTELFFVTGEVRKPGSFSQIEGTTLRQAIAMAEGTTFKAAPKRTVIFREDPRTGRHEEIHVDVADIMKGGKKGQKKDIPILANDIIVVPNSRIKSITTVLLTGFGSGLYNIVRLPTTY